MSSENSDRLVRDYTQGRRSQMGTNSTSTGTGTNQTDTCIFGLPVNLGAGQSRRLSGESVKREIFSEKSETHDKNS